MKRIPFNLLLFVLLMQSCVHAQRTFVRSDQIDYSHGIVSDATISTTGLLAGTVLSVTGTATVLGTIEADLVRSTSGYRVQAEPLASGHLADGTLLARLNQGETITAQWLFSAGIRLPHNSPMLFGVSPDTNGVLVDNANEECLVLHSYRAGGLRIGASGGIQMEGNVTVKTGYSLTVPTARLAICENPDGATVEIRDSLSVEGGLSVGNAVRSATAWVGALQFCVIASGSETPEWIIRSGHWCACPNGTEVLRKGLYTISMLPGTHVESVTLHGEFLDSEAENRVTVRVFEVGIAPPSNPFPLTGELARSGGQTGVFSLELDVNQTIREGHALVIQVKLRNAMEGMTEFFGVGIRYGERVY